MKALYPQLDDQDIAEFEEVLTLFILSFPINDLTPYKGLPAE